MSKYKLTQKTDANGTTQDIVLDASCVDGVVKSVNNQTPDSNGNVNVSGGDLSNYVDLTSAQTISGVKTMTNGLKVSGRSVGGGDDEGIVVGVASNNYAGVCCGSPSGRRAVFYLKPSATSGNSVWRYNNGSTTYDIAHPEKAGTIALTSDIPTESTVSGWGFTKNEGTITGVQLNGSSIATSGVANVKALPNFNLNISHQTAGNPRPVKFLTINYATAATYFKMSATSCHDNGTSYQFLEDIIIGCTTGGSVVCNVYKYCQQSVTYDSATRNYGDVFYVIDTTNKIVDFYILCGQYASSQFTPATKIGNTTIAYITQYTGTATYYSSGTKVWADGNSTTYAKLSEVSPLKLIYLGRFTTATLISNITSETGIALLLMPSNYSSYGLTITNTNNSSQVYTSSNPIVLYKGSSNVQFRFYQNSTSGTSITYSPSVLTVYNCKVYKLNEGWQ